MIREGTPKDLDDVYTLSKKLIEFEKVEEFVSLTQEGKLLEAKAKRQARQYNWLVINANKMIYL